MQQAVVRSRGRKRAAGAPWIARTGKAGMGKGASSLETPPCPASCTRFVSLAVANRGYTVGASIVVPSMPPEDHRQHGYDARSKFRADRTGWRVCSRAKLRERGFYVCQRSHDARRQKGRLAVPTQISEESPPERLQLLFVQCRQFSEGEKLGHGASPVSCPEPSRDLRAQTESRAFGWPAPGVTKWRSPLRGLRDQCRTSAGMRGQKVVRRMV